MTRSTIPAAGIIEFKLPMELQVQLITPTPAVTQRVVTTPISWYMVSSRILKYGA